MRFLSSFMLVIVGIVAFSWVVSAALQETDKILDENVIAAVNGGASSWVAGRNARLEGMTVGEFKHMLGGKKSGKTQKPVVRAGQALPSSALPASFDWRKNAQLLPIVDQGHCGSCWAVSMATCLTDRVAIYQKAAPVQLSAQDLTSCSDAGSCDGGFPADAWNWVQQNGLPTEKCYPYEMGTCHHPGCSEEPTPPCRAPKCHDGEVWKQTLRFVNTSYGVSSDDQSIMTEIMTNGPIQAAFDVYSDFANYKTGIYVHTSGSFLGGHAVEIIGWTTDPKLGVAWLVKNSWNTSWGMDGLFYIKSGQCGINDDLVAGFPRL